MNKMDAKILDAKIRDAFFKHFNKNSKETHTLMFLFDKVPFSTDFIFNADGLTNGCININFEDNRYAYDISSHISTNSAEKKCFAPPLTKDNLPDKVTQTDILQVLTTKLKLMLLDKPRVSLFDKARLLNPSTGKEYTSLFSLWRALRGEPSIYEKYGYTSIAFSHYRRYASFVTWGRIKKRVINPQSGFNLEDLWTHAYPDKPIADGMTIKEVMKNLSYDDTEKSVIEVPKYTEDEEKRVKARIGTNDPSRYIKKIDICDEILKSMVENAGVTNYGTPKLNVDIYNDIWKSWDSRCTFISFGAVTGGKRRRKTRRRTNKK